MSHDPFAPEPDPRTRVPLTIEKLLIAVGMAAIALITAANVVSRCVTSISLAFNLMVSCRIAGVTMESAIPWVVWMVLAMLVSRALVAVFQASRCGRRG